jgi:hypothetical protein
MGVLRHGEHCPLGTGEPSVGVPPTYAEWARRGAVPAAYVGLSLSDAELADGKPDVDVATRRTLTAAFRPHWLEVAPASARGWDLVRLTVDGAPLLHVLGGALSLACLGRDGTHPEAPHEVRVAGGAVPAGAVVELVVRRAAGAPYVTFRATLVGVLEVTP